MKKTNSPNVMNRKRKIALSNLKARLTSYRNERVNNEWYEKASQRIEKEIAVLKSRIIG